MPPKKKIIKSTVTDSTKSEEPTTSLSSVSSLTTSTKRQGKSIQSNGENKLTNPYVNTVLAARVCLKPNQLNNDIYINMKNNLKNNLEGKCNKYGFIKKIHKILEHKDGVIYPEDLSGSVMYDVKYSTMVCLPLENTNIVCKITNVENNLFTATNGPVLFILKQIDMDNEVFGLDKGNVVVKKEGKKLEIGDYVIVYVRNKRFYTGDNIIISIGRLLNIASQEEVDKYFNPPHIEEDETAIIKEEVKEAVDFVEPEFEKDNFFDLN